MEYRDEQAIAQKAEQMLTSALRKKISSFAQHYRSDNEKPALSESKAKAKTKKYGRKRDGNQQIFLRSLAILMPRHGFVKHFGADTIRKSGERNRKKPRATTYHFAAHYYRLKATPFINEAVEQSGVIPFVSENVAQLRAEAFGEELVFGLNQFSH